MAWFDLPADIRQRLLAVSDITDRVVDRVHYQGIPGDSGYPHVWFTRRSRDPASDTQTDTEAVLVEEYTFEILTTDETDSEPIIDALITSMRALESVTISDRFIQLVEVSDADDDYLFQSVGEDDPDFMHALQISIFHVED